VEKSYLIVGRMEKWPNRINKLHENYFCINYKLFLFHHMYYGNHKLPVRDIKTLLQAKFSIKFTISIR